MCLTFILSGTVFAQNVPEGAISGEVEKNLATTEMILKKRGKISAEKMDMAMDIAIKKLQASAEKMTFAMDLAIERLQASAEKMETPEEEIQVSNEQRFLIKDFEFEGTTVISLGHLKSPLKGYINRELSYQDLKDACQIVTTLYRKQGYFLANAYLKPQEIRDNIVIISVIEGRLGEVKIQVPEHYKEKFIRKHFRPAYKGIINYKKLLKSLLILNEYQDLKVKATLEKGIAPYTVDIAIEVEDKLPLHVSTDYNNFGSRYVSKNRVGVSIEYGNLIFGGDEILIRGVAGTPERTLKFAKAAYSLPVNGYGTKAEFSYTGVDFDVQREYRQLEAGGQSNIYGFSLSHPVTRTQLTNLDFNVGFDYKQAKNYLLGQITSDDELRVFKASLSGDHIDNFNGRNYFSLLGSIGVEDIFGGSEHDDPNASRVGSGGDFIKGDFELGRYQKFIWDTYLLMRNTFQAASDVLPISEELSIGGADTVRGYPQSEYLGDYGYNGSLELRLEPPFISNNRVPFTHKSFKELVQLLGFVDYGNVFRKNALSGEQKHDEIAGAGAGVRLQFTKDINFRIDVGFPIVNKEPSDGANSHVYMQGIARF